MIRWLRCLWLGHEFWTLQFEDGRAYIPPCPHCGASNIDGLRWSRGYREVHEREPRPDELPARA